MGRRPEGFLGAPTRSFGLLRIARELGGLQRDKPSFLGYLSRGSLRARRGRGFGLVQQGGQPGWLPGRFMPPTKGVTPLIAPAQALVAAGGASKHGGEVAASRGYFFLQFLFLVFELCITGMDGDWQRVWMFRVRLHFMRSEIGCPNIFEYVGKWPLIIFENIRIILDQGHNT